MSGLSTAEQWRSNLRYLFDSALDVVLPLPACGWMQTSSGRRVTVSLKHGLEGDVIVEDIAHALANLCRYAGHCSRFLSVAQHSWYVSQLSQPGHERCGLLHDASEAFVVDMPSPIKRALPQYKRLEKAVQRSLAERFDCCTDFACAKEADRTMLATEARCFMPDSGSMWDAIGTPLGTAIEAYGPDESRVLFLDRWKEVRDVRRAVRRAA